MANIGQQYTIYKTPIRLYWDSYKAAARDITQGGWYHQGGSHVVRNKVWTNAQGQYFTSPPVSGGIALYGFDIGWIREDDNLTASTISEFNTLDVNGSSVVRLSNTTNVNHNLVFKIGDRTVKTINNVGMSYTLSFNSSEQDTIYQLMSRTQSATITCFVTTIKDNQVIGATTSYDSTIRVPASMNPTFRSNPTVSVLNPINNKAYQDTSSIKVVTNGFNATKGATIETVSIQVGSNHSNTNTYTTPKLKESGNLPITVTIVDSRGRSAKWQSSIEVVPYKIPGIQSFTCGRTTGTGIAIQATGTFTQVIGKKITFKIESKERSQSNWATKQTGDCRLQGDLWGVNGALTGYDITKSYDLRITVADQLGNQAVGHTTLGTIETPLSLGKKGIGVGKVVDDNGAHLQVNGNVDAKGYLLNGQPFTPYSLLDADGTTKQATGDWNNYKESGFYWGMSLANAPKTTQNYITVKVYRFDGSWIIQEAIDFNGNTAAQRACVYGTWKPWNYVMTSNTVPNTLKSMFDANATIDYRWGSQHDMNTFKHTGFYFVGNGANCPARGVLLVNKISHTEVMQVLFAADSNKVYRRMTHYQTGVWGAWVS
ncbi:hypothetical protein NHG29_09060 [Aerococcaceae bacterium NML160702]|nr:hypothetical protein [Aerococcaceae bacterium NML160702]